MTLESPFHRDLKPSTLETVTRALAMEFWYVAVGPGLITCILVWSTVSSLPDAVIDAIETAYLEHVDGVHNRVFLTCH